MTHKPLTTTLAATALLLGSLAGGAVLAAGSQRGSSSAAQSSQSAPSSQSSSSSQSASSAAQAATPTPTQFALQAAEGGLAEVQLSQLAQKQAQSAAVKQFAARMIDDHGKANMELQALARSKNLTLPKELNAEHKATLKKLQGLKGAEFDAAYMAAMDKDHRKAVALFESASGSNFQDPQLQAFAAKQLPILQEHHQMVQNTQPSSQASR